MSGIYSFLSTPKHLRPVGSSTEDTLRRLAPSDNAVLFMVEKHGDFSRGEATILLEERRSRALVKNEVDEYLEGLATDVVRAAISFDLGDDESVEGDDEVPDSLEFADSLLEDSTMNDSTAVVPTLVQPVGMESDVTQDVGALDATQGMSALVATHDAHGGPVVPPVEMVFSPVGNDVTPDDVPVAHEESDPWEFGHMSVDQDDSGDEGAAFVPEEGLPPVGLEKVDVETAVPRFAGDRYDSLDSWSRKMKAYFIVERLEGAVQVAAAVLGLDGEAEGVYCRLATEPESFTELVEALRTGLTPARLVLAQEILSLRQGDDTIGAFTRRVRAVAIGAGILDDFSQCLWFRKGLREEFIPHVAAAGIAATSLDGLSAHLAGYEACSMGATLLGSQVLAVMRRGYHKTRSRRRHRACIPLSVDVIGKDDLIRLDEYVSPITLGAIGDGDLIKLDGVIGGRRVICLVDSGASRNFVSSKLFSLRGPVSHVKLADGTMKPCVGPTKMVLKMAGHQWEIPVFSVDLDFDVVLGVEWLQQTSPIIDWNAGELSFPKDTARLNMISATELPTMLQQDDTVFLCSVTSSQVPKVDDPKLQALLQEYQDVFPDKLPLELPPDRGCSFRITLVPEARPVVRPLRRFSPADMESLTKEVSQLLEAGLIKPSESEFGAQVLFVDKKDGTRRMCVDYRSLNESTVRDNYPLPRIDEIFDRLSGAKIFSKLDLRSGYHQMRVEPSDTYKTAFRTDMGSFEFLVLPFGLTNAPPAFVRMLNRVFPFGEFKGYLAVYIDDLLIFSRTQREHLLHVKSVLETLRKHKLFVKGSKCVFGAQEVEFLGHIVGANGIKTDPAKVEAIVKLPAPRDVPSLRSFLGMVNYFRAFVKGFAGHAAVLSSLLVKGFKFEWTELHQAAFEALKLALVSAAAVHPFDPKLPVVVQTDASGYAVGAVLLQEVGESHRPVAFYSKKLDKHEVNYSTQKKEGLAVVLALKRWEHYLRGRVFDLETDHKSLLELKRSKDPTHQMARWFTLIAEYPYNPIYRPGPENVTADCLSRLVPDVPTLSVIESGPRVEPDFLQKIRVGYAADQYLGVVHRALIAKEKPEAKYVKRVALFNESDGLLLFGGSRVAIPRDGDIQLSVMKEAHDTPAGGHLGVEATYQALARRFFWPKMSSSVRRYVKGCEACQKSKPTPHAAHGLLEPLPVPQGPWQSIGIDFITGLPMSPAGLNSIMTVVDRFSKMCHFIPTTKDVDAQGVADLFVREVFCRHGLPKSIVSDRDPKFTSEFWKATMKRLGTSLLMSTVDHPQSDGQSERANGTIIQMLRTFCRDRERDWPTFLPLLEFAVNNTVHKPAGMSPFVICSGVDPLLPLDLVAPEGVTRDSSPLAQKIASIQSFVRDNLLLGQAKMAENHNEGRKEATYKVGDQVLMRSDHASSHIEAGNNAKLRELFSGPYIVTKVGTNTVTLDLPKEMGTHPTVNICKIKPFTDPMVPLPQPGPVKVEGGKDKVDDDDDDDEYEIDYIVTHRENRRGTYYLIHWKGWGEKERKWLKEDELANAPEVLKDYKSRGTSG